MKQYIRLDNPKKLDTSTLLDQATGENEVVIQFSEPGTPIKLLTQLNDLCRRAPGNLCVRFYGHYSTSFDASLLKYLPDVKALFLDCLRRVDNFSALQNLQHLEKLNIGIYELQEKDFLAWGNLKNLTYLCLVDNQKNNFDLGPLGAYYQLKQLFLNGHSKNIQTLGTLTNLVDLSLSLPSKAPIDFINQLPNLRKLRLILGGRDSLDEVENYRLENLEIIRVRGFQRFTNLSQFHNLKTLQIEDQIQLRELEFTQDLPNLTDLRVFNCKTLDRLTGLGHLSNLHHLRIYKTALDFPRFMNQDLPGSLKVLAFMTSQSKKDQEIRSRLDSLGYAEME